MTGQCKIDFCSAWVAKLDLCGHLVRVFCAGHVRGLLESPEATRIRSADEEGRLTVHLLVHALADYRTRVELEHRRDRDPQVIAARGGR